MIMVQADRGITLGLRRGGRDGSASGQGLERMLLSVPPLDEAQVLPWPAHWFCR